MDQQVDILAASNGEFLPNPELLIEIAGRTCYKSGDKITADSAERFIKMLIGRGHESVLEHSWFNLLIFDPPIGELFEIVSNRLFSVSEVSENGFTIGGNARMFRDLIRDELTQNQVAIKIALTISQVSELLFDDLPKPDRHSLSPNNKTTVFLVTKPIDWQNREVRLRHSWAMVRFKGGSRAFTHQLVRHRRMGVSQESQRYCDEGGFYDKGYCVIPPSVTATGLEEFYLEQLRQADVSYQRLQKLLEAGGHNKAREDARFLLPNAVCSEIVVSCTLKEWQWIFNMRCHPSAQWEIRQAILPILYEFQSRFPDVFDDFETVTASDGEEAAIWKK